MSLHDKSLTQSSPEDRIRALIVRQRELEMRAQKAEQQALVLKMLVVQMEAATLALLDRVEALERGSRA